MFETPDLRTLEKLSGETGFIRDTLEKMVRLLAILADISSTPDLEGKVALKGGTALQSLHLGFRRLSVDIDFNYIGSVEKAVMERHRSEIRTALTRLLRQRGYDLEDERPSHAEHTFILAYRNSVGNRDRLKVEVNYLERLPALETVGFRMRPPFGSPTEIPVRSYRAEELFAMKSRALLARATPRDLFDVALIDSRNGGLDWVLYRKLFIFYTCMSPLDVRDASTDRISAITEGDVKRHLVPLLRKGGDRPDLDNMKSMAVSHMDKLLAFTEEERRFLDIFYRERQFDRMALFGNMPVNPNLQDHPSIRWRLANLKSART